MIQKIKLKKKIKKIFGHDVIFFSSSNKKFKSMSDQIDNGPTVRAKIAIDKDNVKELSKIPDLQSWCSLSVDGSINIFGREFSNPTITQYAAFNGKSDCLYYILRRCPNVLDIQTDSPNFESPQIALPYPYPLLHLAVLSGNLECVRTVIKFSTLGSSNDFINRKDNLGFIALHFVPLINIEASEIGKDQNSKNSQKDDKQKQLKQSIAKELLKNGADLFCENCMCETPLISALIRDPELFEFYYNYLLQEGKKESLENFLNEKKYIGIDDKPQTILQFFETEPQAYALLKKLQNVLNSPKE